MNLSECIKDVKTVQENITVNQYFRNIKINHTQNPLQKLYFILQE